MMEISEGIRRAQEFLDSYSESEVPLVVDASSIVTRGGVMFAPCNSSEYVQTGKFEAMVIGCTPVRVNLLSGECRFLSLDEVVQLDL